MMIPALALLAVVAAPAPAQNLSDASFAASLGEIQAVAAAAKKVQFSLKPSGPKAKAPAAAAVGPVAADADWAKLIAAVKKDGKYAEGSLFAPARFSLEEKTGDPKAVHATQAVTFMGTLNDDDKFEAMGAVVAVTTFTPDPKTGGFTVEQWMFETDVYGQVTDVAHASGVVDKDGKRGPGGEVPAKLDDPAVKAQFDAQVKFWAERSVK